MLTVCQVLYLQREYRNLHESLAEELEEVSQSTLFLGDALVS